MPDPTPMPTATPLAAAAAAESRARRRTRQAAEARAYLVADVVRRALVPVAAVIAGVALLLMRESVRGALIATVCGIAAGQILKIVMLFVAMGFSAVESGYGDVFGQTPEERASGPSVRYVVYGWLIDILPPLLAAGSTLVVGAVVRPFEVT